MRLKVNMAGDCVFDGHNDLVLRLMRGQVTGEQVAQGLPDGTIDKPRAMKAGYAGAMFAIFPPSPVEKAARHALMRNPPYDIAGPEPMSEADATDWTRKGFAAFDDLSRAGAIRVCRTVDEIEAALPADEMAAVIHIEGAEAIDRNFDKLHQWHAQGLRSVGPVWSRDTVWGYGVPFSYPSDPDTGPGLTDAGKALVRECNALNILVDLSHLNAKGVEDVAKVSDAPLVATHSNAWSVSPHSRNLTDRQLDMIRDTDGMVGINFSCAFLRMDGRMDPDFQLDIVLRHFDHLIERVGEDRVGFGSDFDGALVPDCIWDCTGFTGLLDALRSHGVDEGFMTKITHGNWLAVLRRTWGN